MKHCWNGAALNSVAIALISMVVLCPGPLLAQQDVKPGPGTLPAAARDAAAAPKAVTNVPRVSLDEITGSPGASLMIPLYYTPDPKAPLRSFAVEIDYVSNNLKFQKAARGAAAEQAEAEVTTNLTDGKPDDKGVTRSKLLVTAALAKDAKSGLPDGLMAYLLFTVSMQAKPFAIRLTPTVVSAEDTSNPPKKVAKVTGVPGMVTVEIPDMMPEATCFFFTH
jgi:hypothetical protein